MIFLRSNRDPIIRKKMTLLETSHFNDISIRRIVLHRAKNFLIRCIPCKEIILNVFQMIIATRNRYFGTLTSSEDHQSTSYGNRTYASSSATDSTPTIFESTEVASSSINSESTSLISTPRQSTVILEREILGHFSNEPELDNLNQVDSTSNEEQVTQVSVSEAVHPTQYEQQISRRVSSESVASEFNETTNVVPNQNESQDQDDQVITIEVSEVNSIQSSIVTEQQNDNSYSIASYPSQTMSAPATFNERERHEERETILVQPFYVQEEPGILDNMEAMVFNSSELLHIRPILNQIAQEAAAEEEAALAEEEAAVEAALAEAEAVERDREQGTTQEVVFAETNQAPTVSYQRDVIVFGDEIIVPAFEHTPVRRRQERAVRLNDVVQTHVIESVQDDQETLRVEDRQSHINTEGRNPLQRLASYERNDYFRRRMRRVVEADRMRRREPHSLRDNFIERNSNMSSEYFDAEEPSQPLYNKIIEQIVGPRNPNPRGATQNYFNPFKVLADLGPLMGILEDSKYFNYSFEDPNRTYFIDSTTEGGGLNGGVRKAKFRNDTIIRTFAMKTVLVNFHHVSHNLKMTEIMSEVHMLRQNHPNLAQLKDLRVYNGRVFIFTDYMPYTLSNILDLKISSGINNDVLVHIFVQALKGVEYMHNTLNMIHGDIKGCNIMMDQTGIIKLIDFGFSRPPGKIKGAGTELFMAPELKANGPNNQATDVFALGTTFHHLLCCNSGHKDPFLALLIRNMVTKDPKERMKVSLTLEFLQVTIARRWLRQAEPQAALEHIASNN